MALVLLVGCVAGPELPGEILADDIRDRALVEWIGRGLPAGDCVTWELRVQWLEYEEMDQACPPTEGAPVSLGCYQGGYGYGTIAVSPGDTETLQHELRHWMGQCSGVGADPEHSDERLWYGGVR